MSADALVAAGTLALAGITLITLIVTVVITVQDRKHADKRLSDERARARELEQLAEAAAVQVVVGMRDAGPADPPFDEPTGSAKVVTTVVVNHGRYVITGIDARLRLSGGGNPSLVGFGTRERLPGLAQLAPVIRGRICDSPEAVMHADRLTPWDAGLSLDSDPVSARHAAGAYPVVRWADRWGTRWEHRRGEVQQIADGADWWP